MRFEGEMSLDEQDAVAHAIAGMYGQDPSSVKDMRAQPHSGYRAVHVWLRLPARVEVQVRTHMQGAWANVYEAAADVFGRDIRYRVRPDDPVQRNIVDSLQSLSVVATAKMEEERNSKARELLRLQEYADAGSPIFDKQVRDRLEAEWKRGRTSENEFRDALRKLHDQFRTMQGGPVTVSGFVIEYYRPTGVHRVHEFPGAEGYRDAMRYRLQLEGERTDSDWEIVSLNSSSLEALKSTHSRYFAVEDERQSA
ncbi:GTP pyrophosphokinase [Microbacterium esteraromaticum]|uniref:GTP pyrophosphokinase n=1 Tax=Microbacterium esteraromaticum TaxID=57043 RepID=A0A1R4K9A1_9MICO|nr:GTP pyrophosphokinase [Microbacterium esteraromaticum]